MINLVKIRSLKKALVKFLSCGRVSSLIPIFFWCGGAQLTAEDYIFWGISKLISQYSLDPRPKPKVFIGDRKLWSVLHHHTWNCENSYLPKSFLRSCHWLGCIVTASLLRLPVAPFHLMRYPYWSSQNKKAFGKNSSFKTTRYLNIALQKTKPKKFIIVLI